MADEQDELAALYGDVQEADQDNATDAANISGAPSSAAAGAGEDDDSLFMQLYGDQPAPEEAAAAKPFDPYAAAREETQKAGGQPEAHQDQDQHQAPAPGDAAEPDDSDDDLMITLDENATAYEPSQSKFQYARPGGDIGALGGGASGAGVDDGAGAATIPGLGGFGTRTAIGGIPRSGIPGLAQSLPSSQLLPGSAAGTPQDNNDPYQGLDIDPSAGIGGAGGMLQNVRMAPPRTTLRIEDAVFPSQWRHGLPMKLPGQTRVSPEEYREFLSLGHGEIYDIELDWVAEPPWRYPGIDPGDFFNYGMNEKTWKEYQDRVKRYRIEYTLQNQIQTVDQGRGGGPRQFGMMGLAGGEDGNAMMGDAGLMQQGEAMGANGDDDVDEQYVNFVTAERPPRPYWARFGTSAEHTVVLTGHDLEFAVELSSTAAAAGGGGGGMMDMACGHPPMPQRFPMPQQQQQQFRPPPPAGPPGGWRPPPPGGPALPPPFMQQQQHGGPGGHVENLGGMPPQMMPPMGLPAPFLGPGGMGTTNMGGVPALPPPFMMGMATKSITQQQGGDGGGQGGYQPSPSSQQQQQQQYEPYQPHMDDRMNTSGSGGGGGGLAVGMEFDLNPSTGRDGGFGGGYRDRNGGGGGFRGRGRGFGGRGRGGDFGRGYRDDYDGPPPSFRGGRGPHFGGGRGDFDYRDMRGGPLPPGGDRFHRNGPPGGGVPPPQFSGSPPGGGYFSGGGPIGNDSRSYDRHRSRSPVRGRDRESDRDWDRHRERGSTRERERDRDGDEKRKSERRESGRESKSSREKDKTSGSSKSRKRSRSRSPRASRDEKKGRSSTRK